MKTEIKIFFTALMFYTRIPCPKWVNHEASYLVKSVTYLPLIGWLVGGLSALVLFVTSLVLPIEIAVILAMLVSVLVTGAFHEDGLADVCDAFGGGWTKEKILAIMKDSRVGTYGVVAVVFILLLKYTALLSIINPNQETNYSLIRLIFIALVSGNSLSRLIAITAVVSHNYVRENDDTSKSKPVIKAGLQWNSPRFMMAVILGLLPLFLFQNPCIFTIVPLVYFTKWLMMRFFTKWIGGYTGDCLGAIQQVTEIVFYLGIIVLWKFI